MRRLGVGKVDYDLLEHLIGYGGVEDSSVLVRSRIGEDAAVVSICEKLIVVKTDPIVCVEEDIGYYAPIINANDIAVMGAVPRWFLATVLLPRDADERLADKIFRQMDESCRMLKVSIIGGHTEVVADLERPIIAGMMLGTVERERLVTKSADEGDAVLLVKGIAIEGTSIIARERAEEVRKKHGSSFHERCLNFVRTPGISVVREAMIARDFASAMHDPTEGGLLAGIYELAAACDKGVIIWLDKIPIYEETKILCDDFGLNPLAIFASGALIVTVNPDKLEYLYQKYEKEGIKAVKIGEITAKESGMWMIRGNEKVPLRFSAKDEVSVKLFSSSALKSSYHSSYHS